MNLIVCVFVILISSKIIQAERTIFTYEKCNGTSKYSPAPTCAICNSTEGCLKPREEKCNEALVRETVTSVMSVFNNSEDLTANFKGSKFVCFSMQARDLNEKEFDVRGCMYYQTVKEHFSVVKYTYDFMLMYGKRRAKIYIKWNKKGVMVKEPRWLNFETYDRKYWNRTHFPLISCSQCQGDLCNKIISPYEGGRILFQRPFTSLKQWNCILYQESNKQYFSERCLTDQAVCILDYIDGWIKVHHFSCGKEWDWPNTMYVPPKKLKGTWFWDE